MLIVVIGKLLTFITIPIISRALGPEKYGSYNYILAIANYSIILANWGFLARGIREVAKNPSQSHLIVNELISVRLILALIGIMITVILGLIFNIRYITQILIVLIGTFSVAFYLDFYYYGTKNTLLPSLSHLIGQLVNLILVVILFRNNGQLSTLIVIYVITLCIDPAILIFYYTRQHTIKLNFSLKKAFNSFKSNLILGFGAKAGFFQSSFPALIIPIFYSEYSLGIYSAAYKFFLLISLIMQNFNLVFAPSIVHSRSKNSIYRFNLFYKLLIIYGAVGIIFSGIVYFFSDILVNLMFGDKFSDTIIILKMLGLFMVPIYPIYMLLLAFINNYERDSIYLKSTIVQIIMLLVMSPLFLKMFNIIGIVYALSISTMSSILINFWDINKLVTKRQCQH